MRTQNLSVRSIFLLCVTQSELHHFGMNLFLVDKKPWGRCSAEPYAFRDQL